MNCPDTKLPKAKTMWTGVVLPCATTKQITSEGSLWSLSDSSLTIRAIVADVSAMVSGSDGQPNHTHNSQETLAL